MFATIPSPAATWRALASSRLLRGVAAFGSAELANRIVRLMATIIIARQLAPDIVGEAALALTLFEIVRVLAGIGVGQAIIASDEDRLAATCNTARALFWGWSAVMVVLQLGVAAILGFGFGQETAAAMLAVLALVYPIMPGGLVQVHLAMREGRHAKLAKTAATQAIADQVLTMVLLLAWPSPWSIVLPKLLTAPIWLAMSSRNRPWTADAAAGRVPLKGLLRFGSGVLVADGLNALRAQGDNLIIAAMMGTSALGTYYFAFNAGLGISTALVGAFGTVSFPLLCAAADPQRRTALRHVIWTGIALFAPLVALQALFAPLYVPLVFGDHWAFAAPLIAVLCLGGLTHLASTITANWLRCHGEVGHDAGRSLLTCLAALGGLYLGALTGDLWWAVIGLVVGQSLVALAHAFLILRPAALSRRAATTQTEKLA